MNEDPNVNPFAASDAYYAEPAYAGSGYPTRLRVYAILVLILGVLGLGTGLYALTTLAAQSAAGTPAVGDVQGGPGVEFQSELDSIVKKYWAIGVVMAVAQVACCGALIFGSIVVMMAKPWSGRFFSWACISVLVFEVVRAVVNGFQMAAMFGAMQSMQTDLMPPGQGGAAPAGAFEAAMMIGLIIGIAIAALWLVLKLVVYFLTLRCLSNSDIKAFLASKAEA